MSEPDKNNEGQGLDIAIIGMACRLPGAKSPEEFWENLCAEKESITFFSDDELLENGVEPEELQKPNYVKAASIIDDIALFDSDFFDCTPAEAIMIDPQQRLLLECAWEALEGAGYIDGEKSVGVFTGTKMNTYLFHILKYIPMTASSIIENSNVSTGNGIYSTSTRIAYKLNLFGPTYNIQTACSTSLTAVHLACQSLLLDECKIAIAGGCVINVPQKAGYTYQPGSIFSPDGHCRPFDADAKGTLFGNGIGVIVLKRLEDALADKDTIHAVIKGSAVNNDGASKASFIAPGIEGQSMVILEALASSGVELDSISYVETHGTGTIVGDSIEMAALNEAYRTEIDQKQYCPIGSVKGNIGHLDAASGIAGLIKVVLCLKNKKIPASINFKKPNPEIDFANSPFYVNTTLTDWKTTKYPRRAAVSSFGFGGTNAHFILEEAPLVEETKENQSIHLIPLSAKSEISLNKNTENLIQYLKENPQVNLTDMAYTLQAGRKHFNYRRLVMGSNIQEMIDGLVDQLETNSFTFNNEKNRKELIFMFTGQGSQHVNMTKELYRRERVFKEQVDFCCEFLTSKIDLDLHKIIFPEESDIANASAQINETQIAQLAIFIIEYALVKLFESFGITPQYMIGHSLGEYVAACVAGVFDITDALSILVTRSKLMQKLPKGAMLSISATQEDLLPLLGDKLALAVNNAPGLNVVAGPFEEITALENIFNSKQIHYQRLMTSHAFHSPMVEPILGEFTQALQKIKLNPPKIPYISNVTGKWIEAHEATDPNYWAQHMRRTVQFSQGIQGLLDGSDKILVEIGPGRVLTSLAKSNIEGQSGHVVLTTLPHPAQNGEDDKVFMSALTQIWQNGKNINWRKYYRKDKKRRIPLPTYAFNKRHFWFEGDDNQTTAFSSNKQIKKNDNIAEWVYAPVWKRSFNIRIDGEDLESHKVWLIFTDALGIGGQIKERLLPKDNQVIIVKQGQKFEQLSDDLFTINPSVKEDYDSLIRNLFDSGRQPENIAHLWLTQPPQNITSRLDFVEECIELGFNSLLFLTQALTKKDTNKIKLFVITNNLHPVFDNNILYPEKAVITGPCRVISQEFQQISCRNIDIDIPLSSAPIDWSSFVDDILAELRHHQVEPLVAYRRHERYVQVFDKLELDEIKEKPEKPAKLKDGGIYLITGGIGGIGLTIAEHLSGIKNVKLILTRRSAFPQKNEWDNWIATHDEQDEIRKKIEIIKGFEQNGAEITVAQADVNSFEDMKALFEQIIQQYGKIDGIIHSAGVAGGGVIQLKDSAAARSVLDPKVKGTLILHELVNELLDNKRPDFVILFSSTSALLGEIGQVDYCSANAFMDAFAHYCFEHNQKEYMAINWHMWRQVGMAVQQNLTVELKQIREEQLRLALTPEEGVKVFDKALYIQKQLPQISICTVELAEVIKKAKALNQSSIIDKMMNKKPLSQKVARPNLQTAYQAPVTEAEKSLVEIWENLLGIKDIGIDDDFFELGGHSLLITQIYVHVQDLFHTEFPMQILFENTTIKTLALRIEEIIAKNKSAAAKPILEELKATFPTERKGLLLSYLKKKIAAACGLTVEELQSHINLDALQLDDKILFELMLDFKKEFKLQVFPNEMKAITSLDTMAQFILDELERSSNLAALWTGKKLSDYKLQLFYNKERNNAVKITKKNKPMVFLHSSPRTGSTLMRAMLAGHSKLFCPPELSVLFFETMQEWKDSIGFGHKFDWTSQGLHWAIVELYKTGVDEGWKILDDFVDKNITVQELYAKFQELCGDKMLIDKSPPYCMDMRTLHYAEEIFDKPKYILLYRHPYSVMESMLKLRLDKLFSRSLFMRNDVDPWVVVETVWNISNRNLLTFSNQIDKERIHWVRFEDFVQNPEAIMQNICAFLEIPYEDTILTPYDGKKERMISGLGDPNILLHNKIDPKLADVWKNIKIPHSLDESTKAIAAQLGYELPEVGEEQSIDDSILSSMNLSEDEVANTLDELISENADEK